MTESSGYGLILFFCMQKNLRPAILAVAMSTGPAKTGTRNPRRRRRVIVVFFMGQKGVKVNIPVYSHRFMLSGE